MRASLDIFDRAHAYVEHCRRHYSRQPWRASLSLAWWGLLHSLSREKSSSPSYGKDLRVALVLDGGMGDNLLHIRYIRDLCSQCRPFHLDVYSSLSPQIAQKLFGGIEHVASIRNGRVEENYDLILYSLFVPMTVVCHKERFDKLASRALKAYVESLERFKAKNPHWFIHQKYSMAHILSYARLAEIKREKLPYMTGELPPKAEEFLELELPQPVFPWGTRRFVTISRGSGAEQESTKLWPVHSYNKVMSLLRARFPGVIFVQTGKLYEKKLEADYDLRGKTSVEELAVLMRNAALHISSESGTVHLRHLLRGGPSVVFFGPTDPIFYGYEENCNLRAEDCMPCEWVQLDWQKNCCRGFGACRALEALKAEDAVQRILKHPNISETLCKMS